MSSSTKIAMQPEFTALANTTSGIGVAGVGAPGLGVAGIASGVPFTGAAIFLINIDMTGWVFMAIGVVVMGVGFLV
jgi:hypothetical protein